MSNRSGGVSHSASIVRNVRAIGEDTLHLLPDRMIQGAVKGAHTGWFAAIGAPLGFFFGLILDVAEIASYALMLPKNLIDCVAHLFALIANALRGARDGQAAAPDTFSFSTPTSAWPQFTWTPRSQTEKLFSANVPTTNATTQRALAPPKRQGI
jgi:hypothetical protein